MIKLECDEGHCELEMSGTAAILAAETGTMVQAVYNGIVKNLPECTHNSFGNIYRLTILKALTECKPENRNP